MDDDQEVLDWGNEDDEQNQEPNRAAGVDDDADDAVSLGDESEAESPPPTQARSNEDEIAPQAAPTTTEPQRRRTPGVYERSNRTEELQRPKTDSPGRGTKTTPGRLTHALPPKPAVVLDVAIVSTTAKATSMKAVPGRNTSARPNDTPPLAAKNLTAPTDNELPPDWEIRYSSSKKEPYYWNTRTKESSWTRPTSNSTSDSRAGEDPVRVAPPSPTLSKRPPLSPHRNSSYREDPSKRSANSLSRDDRYYRPGESDRVAREPRGTRREEPRLTAVDTIQHGAARGRPSDSHDFDSRREPPPVSRGREAEPALPSSTRARQNDMSSLGPSRPGRYSYPALNEDREDRMRTYQSDRSDGRRPETQSYPPQNESLAPPRRRLSGSPPPTQRHVGPRFERRADRDEDPLDASAILDSARRKERPSRFGPSVSSMPEDLPSSRRDFETPRVPRGPAADLRNHSREIDLGGYSGEVIYATDGSNRHPSPSAPRPRHENDPRRNSHLGLRPHNDNDRHVPQPRWGAQQDQQGERYGPEQEQQTSLGKVHPSRVAALASLNAAPQPISSSNTASSRDSHRSRAPESAQADIDIAPRLREPRGPRDIRPAQMPIDVAPRRDDPIGPRYAATRPAADGPPPGAPKWPRRGRSPPRELQASQYPSITEVDRSRLPAAPVRDPPPPLRTEPRKARRADIKLASGTNNIPIKNDRYANSQRRGASLEPARPQERVVENGSVGKEVYERPPPRDEPPSRQEPERGARRPPTPTFEKPMGEPFSIPPHMQNAGERDRYRDESKRPPALAQDRNGASHRSSDRNGYERHDDDRYRPAPSRDVYPRGEEPPRPVSPRHRRRDYSPPRGERNSRWEEPRAEPLYPSRPPLSPARSRTSHSDAPRMVHPLPLNPMLAKEDQRDLDAAPVSQPWSEPPKGRWGSPTRGDRQKGGPGDSGYPERDRGCAVESGCEIRHPDQDTISPRGGRPREEPMNVDHPRESAQEGLGPSSFESPSVVRTHSLLERLGGGPEKEYLPLRERVSMVDGPTSAGIKRDHTSLDSDSRDDPTEVAQKRKRRGGAKPRRSGGRR